MTTADTFRPDRASLAADISAWLDKTRPITRGEFGGHCWEVDPDHGLPLTHADLCDRWKAIGGRWFIGHSFELDKRRGEMAASDARRRSYGRAEVVLEIPAFADSPIVRSYAADRLRWDYDLEPVDADRRVFRKRAA